MSELITDELLEESANAVYGEWSRMIAEMGIAESARTFVSPGNYRLLRAALGPLFRDLAAARREKEEMREALEKLTRWGIVPAGPMESATRSFKDGAFVRYSDVSALLASSALASSPSPSALREALEPTNEMVEKAARAFTKSWQSRPDPNCAWRHEDMRSALKAALASPDDGWVNVDEKYQPRGGDEVLSHIEMTWINENIGVPKSIWTHYRRRRPTAEQGG